MNYEGMDAETVAGLLGVGDRQLRNYCSKGGCPFEQRGRDRVFNWPDVLDWYVAFKAGAVEIPQEDSSGRPPRDQRQENLRKTIAEADLKELQLGRLRGEVIVTADAKLKLDRMLGNLRSRLLSLPSKITSRIGGMKEPAAREAAIRDELETICRDLSTGSIVDLPPEPDPIVEEILDTLEAAADPQPQFTDEDFGF